MSKKIKHYDDKFKKQRNTVDLAGREIIGPSWCKKRCKFSKISILYC